MKGSPTRREILTVGGASALSIISGCIGSGNIFGPGYGTIHIYDAGWATGQELRIVAKANRDIAINKEYELPVSSPKIKVKDRTYQINVYLSEEQVESYKWDITQCANDLYIMFGEEPEDGIEIQTSAC